MGKKAVSRRKPGPVARFFGRPLGKFFTSLLSTWLILGSISLFLLYGPWDGLRVFLITTAETTLNHKNISRLFYDMDTINEVMESNKVVELETTTDTGAVQITKPDNDDKEQKNTVKLSDISKDGYKAWKLEVSDPSKIILGKSAYFGVKGQKMPYLLENYPDSVAGVNAGGFSDAKGWGNGGLVVGLCVSEGEIINFPDQYYYNIVGFNEDDVLVLGKFKKSELEGLKLRDAVEFTPFLIINGEPAQIKGNGGWGTAPRTAIGQRKDGTVVFVVVDGRQPGWSIGVTMKQLQDIMVEEGCYNAANLDGGSSSVLSYNGGIVNRPSGSDADGMRFIPNAFVIME